MPPLGQFGRRAQGLGGCGPQAHGLSPFGRRAQGLSRCGLQAHGLSQFGLQARAPRGITFMAKT